MGKKEISYEGEYVAYSSDRANQIWEGRRSGSAARDRGSDGGFRTETGCDVHLLRALMADIFFPNEYITLSSLVTRLHLPRSYLERLAKEGKIPCLDVGGGRLRFREDDVIRGLQALTTKGNGNGPETGIMRVPNHDRIRGIVTL